MQKEDGRVFVIDGSLNVECSFDEERNQTMVACPGCGRAFVAADQRGEGPNRGHEPDCPLQKLLARFTEALNAS